MEFLAFMTYLIVFSVMAFMAILFAENYETIKEDIRYMLTWEDEDDE